MLHRGLVFLAAFSVAASASCFAADLPTQSPCARHDHVWRRVQHARPHTYAWGGHLSVAYGLVPGLGQLGAAAEGYYGARHCWTYEPAYDVEGDYLGPRPVNQCLN